MDRNKDGFITKGELKLAKKKMSMKEVDQTIKDYDIDQDGKLNYEEFLKGKGKKWNDNIFIVTFIAHSWTSFNSSEWEFLKFHRTILIK